MQDFTQQPRKYDAVIGGTATTPRSAVVLGGLDGVKNRLASADVSARRNAVEEALGYGDAGLDLALAALKDESVEVVRAAYSLLTNRTEPKVQQALKQFNHWQLMTCRWSFEGHYEEVTVAFGADGQTVISGSFLTIEVWDLNTGGGRLLPAPLDMLSACEGSNGESGRSRHVTTPLPAPLDMLSACEGSNGESGRGRHVTSLRTLKGHSNWVYSVAISSDGRTIVSGSLDKTIKVWDINTGQCLRTLKGHSSFVFCISISSDGQTVVSGSQNGTIKVWDINTGHCLRTLEGHSNWVYSVAICSDGRTIISGSLDNTIKVWDINTGGRPLPAPLDMLSACEGSNGESGRGRHVTSLRTLQGHTGTVTSVAISPDDRTVISGSGDNTIKVWDINTGHCLRTLEGHTDTVSSVAISPEARTVISGSGDKTIKVWDINTGQCLRTLQGHTDTVNSVAISPDGQTVISGSGDKTIKVWGHPST